MAVLDLMGERAMQRWLRSVAVATVSAFALTGCTKVSSGSASGGNAWTTPHVLTYADSGDVNTLNPHLGQSLDVGYIGELTMAWLIKWDEHNLAYPELATEIPTKANGGVSKDGLTITYHIRKGVKWADGAPFDADDVVFSTKVVLNPANNEVGRVGWDHIVKIDEPDKYTVIYHLSKPYSPFIETFFSTAGGNPCILPKHLLGGYANINNVPYNAAPVGIGPFKVARWERGSQVVMVANPLYWRGVPKLQKIVFKIVPDRDTVIAQLQAHELDLWPVTVPGGYFARGQAIPGFTLASQPGYQWAHLDFNLTRPGVSDPVVRQAIRLATDRATIITKLRHGHGTLQEVTTPPGAPFYVRDISRVPFDIAQANALLDKSGWTRGPDGIRAKNGVKLDLAFATNSGSPDTDEQIELMRQWWQQIGVAISVRHYPYAQLFAPEESGGIVYGGKWDMILFNWVSEAIGDYSAEYSCKSFPPAGQNNIRWCNPRAEAAMDALFAHYDQAQRNGDVSILQHELVKDAPTIVMWIPDEASIYNSDLKNFHPNGVSPFDNMMDVDI
jgi:peptide/nickel transport system substrate-binding protein